MSDPKDVLATHLQELRRGTIVAAALAACAEPRYGYALLTTLAESGLDVDANTLYPLLRRLEKQGLLEARWDTDESRPRKYYSVTAEGGAMLEALRREWASLTTSLSGLWELGPRKGSTP